MFSVISPKLCSNKLEILRYKFITSPVRALRSISYFMHIILLIYFEANVFIFYTMALTVFFALLLTFNSSYYDKNVSLYQFSYSALFIVWNKSHLRKVFSI